MVEPARAASALEPQLNGNPPSASTRSGAVFAFSSLRRARMFSYVTHPVSTEPIPTHVCDRREAERTEP